MRLYVAKHRTFGFRKRGNRAKLIEHEIGDVSRLHVHLSPAEPGEIGKAWVCANRNAGADSGTNGSPYHGRISGVEPACDAAGCDAAKQQLVVTERGEVVARLVPAGAGSDAYAELAARFGSSVPVEPLEAIAPRLSPPGARAGTTDAYLAEGRAR